MRWARVPDTLRAPHKGQKPGHLHENARSQTGRLLAPTAECVGRESTSKCASFAARRVAVRSPGQPTTARMRRTSFTRSTSAVGTMIDAAMIQRVACLPMSS